METIDTIGFFAEHRTLFLIAHVFSIIVGMGTALVSDTLFMRYSRDRVLTPTETSTLDFLSNIVWVALSAIALTGVAVFASDPVRLLDSVKFMAKMSIFVALVANGTLLHFLVKPHLKDRAFLKASKDRSMRRVAFACGSVSFISWTTLFILGMLKSISLSYPQMMGFYSCIILGGMCVAISMEYILFEKKI